MRGSFDQQEAMRTLGAELVRVETGEVEIALPYSPRIAQQHGYVHAGVLAAVLDSACGYAALTRMPAGKEVVSVEFKVNLLAPAVGDRFRAVGKARRSGRTLTVCTAEAFATAGGKETLVALMQATMFAVDAG